MGNGLEDENKPADCGVPNEIYVELARMMHESFLNRRNYEWKVAFGLWTAIGAWTYFAIAETDKLEFKGSFYWVLSFVYLVLLVAWFFCWQVPLRKAFEKDKLYKHYYMDRAESLVASHRKMRARSPFYPVKILVGITVRQLLLSPFCPCLGVLFTSQNNP